MADAPTQITKVTQLFGVTDQVSAPTLVAVTMYERGSSTVINSGTANLNVQSMDLAQGSSSEMGNDGVGVPSSLTIFAEYIEAKLSVFPEGISATLATALADALLAASVPPKGAYCKIAHAPVMKFGPFRSNAFNSVDWQVQDASCKFAAAGRGTVDLTLRRWVSANMANPFPPA